MISRSNDEHLVSLIDIQCRSISWANDRSLKADLADITAEVKQHIDPKVVDVVLEMNQKFREGLAMERYADRKAPWVFVANMYNKTWSKAQEDQSEARNICKEKLRPLLGDARANEVFRVCFHKAWAEQNSEDYENAGGGALTGSCLGYKDVAIHDDLYAEYYTRFLGFSTYPEISKNVSIKLLCYYRARYWTAEKVPSTWTGSVAADYGPRSRKAAFEIAELRAKVELDAGLVDDISEMAAHCRNVAHLDRFQSSPAARLGRFVGWSLNPFAADEEPEETVEGAEQLACATRERLRTRLGTKADLLYELCKHCAWHEQNKVDYDHSSPLDKQTGAANGYLQDAEKDYHQMQLTSYRLGFE